MSEIIDFLGRGWKHPIALDNERKIALSEAEDSISQSIMLILGTAKGERIMRPDFGCEIRDLVFEVNNSATTTMVAYHVEEALQKWEPRINVLGVNVTTDEDYQERLLINIEYEVKSSNSKKNLVYPFYLEGRK